MQTPSESNSPTSLHPEGFLAIRNGLFDHLNQGCLTPNELAVYIIILHQCDWSSGLWNGNAYRIEFALGKTLPISKIQRAMRGLERKKYTRSYHKKGHRGNYFVSIHKFCVSVGDQRGMYLNAYASETYKTLVYEEKSDKDVIATSSVSDAYLRCISGASEAYLYQEYKNSRSPESQEAQEGQEVKTLPVLRSNSQFNISGQVEALASDLSEKADEQEGVSIVFDNSRKAALALLMQRHSAEDIKTAWGEYLDQHVDGSEYSVSHAARLFTEVADQLIHVLTRKSRAEQDSHAETVQ